LIRDGAAEHDRAPDEIARATVLTVAVHRDKNKARRTLARFINTYYGVSFERAKSVVGCIAGSLDEVVDFAAGFVQVGVRNLLLRFAADDQRAEIERWGPPLRAAFSRLESDRRGPRGSSEPEADTG
jgi:hypothetical protein